MHSRRSFFGILAGLAALVPLPAWARSEKPDPDPFRGPFHKATRPPPDPSLDFYNATWDMDFLELPPPMSIFEWEEERVLDGTPTMIRRIKIMAPGEKTDIPVMFALPPEPYNPVVSGAEAVRLAPQNPLVLPPRPRWMHLCPFEYDDHGNVVGERSPEESAADPSEPDPMERLAQVVESVRGFSDESATMHPIWVTLYQNRKTKHMICCTTYEFGADDLVLILPARLANLREIIREPPSPYDAGETSGIVGGLPPVWAAIQPT